MGMGREDKDWDVGRGVTSIGKERAIASVLHIFAFKKV